MLAVYEQFFYMKQHGHWSFWEAYNLPIKMRTWFVQRLSKHFEEQNKEQERAAAAARRSK